MKKPRLPSSRFNSERAFSVKRVAASLLVALLAPSLTWADEPLVVNPSAENEEDIYKNLPEIEARTFDSEVMRKSKSGRVFLFESERAPFLPVGRILLFKRDSQQIFAVRVLKIYGDKNNFAAKGIRYYGQDHQINPSDKFFTVEKIADLNPAPPTAQDRADLNELEKAAGLSGANQGKAPPPPPPPTGAPGQDPGSPGQGPGEPAPLSPDDAKAFKQAEEDDALGLEMKDIMIEEIPIFDPNYQWLTMGFAYLQNAGAYFAAGGMRYGVTLRQRPLYYRMHLQDSLVLEGGAYVYKALNYATLSDSYLVLNSLLTVRYNLLFSQDFGMFFYLGGLQNTAWATTAQSTAQIAGELSGPGIAVGLGFIFRVGPNWDTRVDLGTDSAGLGLMLRF